jgi:CubicO group peptidase (beta-lactamase class C family)
MKRIKEFFIGVFIMIAIVVSGYAGFGVYGSYKINELPKMSFEEMLDYTLNDNEDGVISIGIIKNGKKSITVYGENSVLLNNTNHIYEIGSLTKTFTTSLLSKAISEGKLSLDDSIDKFLTLDEKEYYPTIRRLVTHTSGYDSYYFEKPMIMNFLNHQNDYYGITKDMIIKRINKINLIDIDYDFKYSNFGLSVIGLVLESVYNQDYVDLMNEYISNDLKLSNTKIADNSGNLNNYWKWNHDDAYLAAGGLISNITDMLNYLEFHMSEENEYIKSSHQPLTDIYVNNESYQKMGILFHKIAMGWIIDAKHDIIWHNGGTGHYNCYLALNLDKQVGVIILSNLQPNYRIPTTVMGARLIVELLTDKIKTSL